MGPPTNQWLRHNRHAHFCTPGCGHFLVVPMRLQAGFALLYGVSTFAKPQEAHQTNVLTAVLDEKRRWKSQTKTLGVVHHAGDGQGARSPMKISPGCVPWETLSTVRLWLAMFLPTSPPQACCRHHSQPDPSAVADRLHAEARSRRQGNDTHFALSYHLTFALI